VQYREELPYAEAAAGMLQLLEIADATEADQAGLIHIGPINLQFLGAGGGFLEYRIALTAAIERGYLTLHPSGGYISSPRLARTVRMKCAFCTDTGWIYGNHRCGFGEGPDACCGGAGIPCPTCNIPEKDSTPRMPDSLKTEVDTDGWRH
jgi:hypothetical protein